MAATDRPRTDSELRALGVPQEVIDYRRSDKRVHLVPLVGVKVEEHHEVVPPSAEVSREELGAKIREARHRFEPREDSMPRYVPLHPSLSEEADQAFDAEWRAELNLTENRENFEAAKERRRVSLRDVDPYGPDSEHSWVRDSAAVLEVGGDHLAKERLDRSRSARETRAVSTSVLSFVGSQVLPPWVAESIGYGVRSTAPFAAALLRLDLPPSGDSASWAKVTTGASFTAGSQSAENAALTASADPVIASAQDDLKTIGSFIDVSSQSIERSGGWADMTFGRELGRAFGARLEQQIWNGAGGAQLTGLTVMSGSSSSTVAGQTLGNQTAKVWAQYQAVADNLGELPDLVAVADRRAGGLGSLAAALALPWKPTMPVVPENVVVSPAAPVNLGGGTNEDWIVVMNRAAVPLVMAPNPTVQMQRQQAGNTLDYRMIMYAYVALGVSRRPEGVGLVKGLTAPTY